MLFQDAVRLMNLSAGLAVPTQDLSKRSGPANVAFPEIDLSTTNDGRQVIPDPVAQTKTLAKLETGLDEYFGAMTVAASVSKHAPLDMSTQKLHEALGLTEDIRYPVVQKTASIDDLQKRFTNRSTQSIGEEMQLIFDKVQHRLSQEVRELIQKAINACDCGLFVRLMNEALID